MLDFSFTQEQLEWKGRVISVAQSSLGKNLRDRDRRELFDTEGWHVLTQLGLPGLLIPEQYGGKECDPLTALLALEGLGYGCCDYGLIFSLNAHLWGCSIPIACFGDEQQKTSFLPKLCAGKAIGALAASERKSGSDVFSLQTNACRQGDNYLLNGRKMFITNAPVADVFLVLTTLDASKGPLALTAFLVEKETPGLTVGTNIEKMGLRTTPMGELIFEDCVVPASNRLGSEGNGMAIFNHAMNWERGFILSHAIGAMQRVLEQCVLYAQKRYQFGQAICKYQAISHKIVEMHQRLEISRLLLYKVGWLKQRGESAAQESAMTKLYISDAWVQNCQDALHIHGGYGYLTESGLERELRDAIGSQIYSGTAEIQREIIARFMNL